MFVRGEAIPRPAEPVGSGDGVNPVRGAGSANEQLPHSEDRLLEERWEARLVVLGMLLASVGLVGTAVVMTAFRTAWEATPNLPGVFFLIAWVGAIVLTFVVLRSLRRTRLASELPWPLRFFKLQFLFLGRAPAEAASMLALPRAFGLALTGLVTGAFLALVVIILVS